MCRVWINIQRQLNIVATTWKLRASRGTSAHQMQAFRTCNTKLLVDPRTHMVPTMQRNRIVGILEAYIHMWVPKNGKMCKVKWNRFNFNYKKLDYHKGIGNHILFWEMITKEHDKHHLLHQFNK
jgi:hypothetical protein